MKGISTILNTTFEETKDLTISKDIKSINKKIETYSDNRMRIEDKEFLRNELMDLISSTKFTLQIIEDELKRPPIKSTLIEAFAMLTKEMRGYINELRQLNNDVIDVELKQRKQDNIDVRNNVTNNTTNNVYMFDSKSLDAMLDNAKKNNMLNAIDVDFKEDNIK